MMSRRWESPHICKEHFMPRTPVIFVLALMLALTAAAGFVACAADEEIEDGGRDGAVIESEASSTFGNSESGACPVNAVCSDDLHSVIDGHGNAATACPGTCVPACEAAAASKSSVGCDYFVYPP